MTAISSQTDLTVEQVDKLSGPLLELSKTTPQGPDQWAESLLELAKIGTNYDDMLTDLEMASKAATIGQARLPDVAGAAGAAWLAGIKGGEDFSKVIKEMTAAIGTGNISMTQLTRAMGTGILPTAKAAGLSIQDVFGALSLLTDEGYQGSSAMAQMATALHFLYNPTAKAEKALGTIGLSGDILARDMRKPRGLLEALTHLGDALDTLPGGRKGVAATQTLGDIFPGGRGRILLVLLNQLDRYRMKMDQQIEVQKKFEQSFEDSMNTPLNRMNTAIAEIKANLIILGGDLLPIVSIIFAYVADKVNDAVTAFHKLDPATQKWILIGIGLIAVLGPILVMAGLLVMAVSALLNPVVLVVAAIAGLAAGLVYLYNESDTARAIMDGLWDVILFGVTPLAHLIMSLDDMVEIIKGIPGIAKTASAAVVNWLIGMMNEIIGIINKAIELYNSIPIAPDIDTLGNIGRVTWGDPQPVDPAGFSRMPRGGAASAPPAASGPPALTPGPGVLAPSTSLVVPVTVMTPNGDVLGTAVGKSNTNKRSRR